MEYHHGPYHHMSPSGIVALVISVVLIIAFLGYLPPGERYILVAAFLILGITLAAFLRGYFRRQASEERVSLLPESEQEFEPSKRQMSVSYERILKDYPHKNKCPYCKNDFTAIDRIIFCGTCRAIHHLDCWNDNEGCGIFGCKGNQATSS